MTKPSEREKLVSSFAPHEKIAAIILSIQDDAEKMLSDKSVEFSEVERLIVEDISKNFVQYFIDAMKGSMNVSNIIMHLLPITYLAGLLGIGSASANIFLKTVEKQKKAASEGGRTSAETRNEKANRKYRNAAKLMIKAERAKNPGYSQDKIATEVIALWKDEEIPSYAQIKRLISAMEKAAEIPKRAV